MRIELSRTVPVDLPADELRRRLLGWAGEGGFTCEEDSPGLWVFRRGSHWHALYTFNIRKIPAEVSVLHLPLSREAACSMWCGSWLTMQTAGDQGRVEAEFAQLVACLLAEGAEGGRWRADGEDVPGGPRSATEDHLTAPPPRHLTTPHPDPQD